MLVGCERTRSATWSAEVSTARLPRAFSPRHSSTSSPCEDHRNREEYWMRRSSNEEAMVDDILRWRSFETREGVDADLRVVMACVRKLGGTKRHHLLWMERKAWHGAHVHKTTQKMDERKMGKLRRRDRQSDFWLALVWRTGQRLLTPCQLEGILCPCNYSCSSLERALFAAVTLASRVVIERRDSDRSLFKWRVHLAVHFIKSRLNKPLWSLSRAHTWDWKAFAAYPSSEREWTKASLKKRLTRTRRAYYALMLVVYAESAHYRRMTDV